ncbi:Com family DNA-binding transcriptional regulator [Rodentibacter sp. Ppn85]|nr:Com family DNA-binding transcriptional regulator [Rodentibacter sp. Ppn85]OOF65118.1 hypothetical protein BKL51_06085 [Rodentibacter sp. Ppn85]
MIKDGDITCADTQIMPATQKHPAYSHLPPASRGERILTKPLKMGNADMQKLKEIRCKCCKKLLARAENIQHLEIKCVRCKTLNQFNK